MSESNEYKRYNWSTRDTNLLVSIWRDDLIQNQLKKAARNQAIWESIARYMSRKGFNVTGAQCKTRIRNMLCSYQEAVVKKKDLKRFQPYNDIFKEVLEKHKNVKKKEGIARRLRRRGFSKETDTESEISLDSNSFDDGDQNAAQNSEHQEEVSDVKNEESLPTCVNTSEILNEVKRLILQTVDSQMKTILDAIQGQSQMVEKIVKAERDKLEPILVSERESRRILETRLDMLLSKLETIMLPQVAIVGTLIEPPGGFQDFCQS